MAERNLQAEMDAWKKERNLQAEMDAWKAEQAPAEEEEQPWYGSVKGAVKDWQDFSEGIGVSALETYYGAKDLVGLGEETKMSDLITGEKPVPPLLQKWRDAAEGGWGTAGQITGDVAQLAVPGTAGLKAAKALNTAGKAAGAARALPLAADVAGVTGHGALRLPDEGETRLQNAIDAAQWGVGGAAAGKAAKTLLTGATGTAAANRLRDAGAKLTAGQTMGPGWATTENILSITPFAARPLARARQKSEESIHRIALRDAAPPGMKPVEMGQKGVDELYEGFQRGYQEAWGPMSDLGSRIGGRIDLVAQRGMKSLSKGQKRKVQNVLNDMNDVYMANPGGNAQKLDVLIKNAIVGGKKTREVDKVLKDIRKTLRSGLPKESQSALAALDKQWPKYLVVESAAATPGAAKKAMVGVPGEFGPENLATGVKKVGKDRLTGRGKAPLQELSNDWFTVKGQQRGIIPTKALRLIQSPIFSDFSGLQGTLNRRIAGTGLGQKQLRDMMQEEWAKRLRYGVSGARLGGALEGETY